MYMIFYAQQWMNRYWGRKGQGMTEYAIILLIVVAIGAAIYGSSGDGAFAKGLEGIYYNIITKINAIGTGA